MNQELTNAVEALRIALDNSEELKNYRTARQNYYSDTELMKQINEYNLQASLLEQEGRKPEDEKDDTLVQSISRRLRDIYDELEKSENLAVMRKAEDALTTVINTINDTVRFTIDPEACTHDCSTCGGCCH